MFTGIIETLGRVVARKESSLEVGAALAGAKPGHSVAVNGVCLTVTPRSRKGKLVFDVSPETWARTSLGALRPDDRVNLEPSLKLNSILGGHLVMGHVDACADILELDRLAGEFARLRVALPKALRGLVAEKGSVAVDGISLTVSAVSPGFFEAALIPETLERTNLGGRRPGDAVNLEADPLARYVRSCLEAMNSKVPSATR